MRTTAGMSVLGLLLAAGCGYEGSQDLPLPGAVGGDDTYRVTMTFDDATNLVPKETCRTNDTVVGSVESVELDERLRATVVCVIKDSVSLPANVVATLRETSLLGERFVGLDPPAGTPATGELGRDASVPQSSTRVHPNAEMVLGALSQLLNGGSLGSIQTISQELSTALEGSDAAGTTRRLRALVGQLNDHRGDITASLEAMDRLTARVAGQRTVLASALDSVPDGLAVLDRQRPQLTETLRSLGRLSRTVTPLIARSKDDVIADLQHLRPILSQLSKEGDELALTLERVATFPFPSTFTSTVKGDYAGMYASMTLDLQSLSPLLAPRKAPRSSPGRPSAPDDAPTGLSGLLGLPEEHVLGPLLGGDQNGGPLDLGTLLQLGGGGR